MAMSGSITKAAEKSTASQDSTKLAVRTMKNSVEAMMPAIKQALPSVITPERFSRIVLSALSNNPQLAATTQKSFLGAMMTCAQLGIEPNTPLGLGYLIPYYNKGTLECQFQLGYKGLIQLAYRSGQISTISAHTVYSNDKFEFTLGLEPTLVHVPCMGGDRGAPVAYYATYKTKDLGYGFEVMSVADAQAHRAKFSKAKFSPWDNNFDEMAKKTVLKRALKYAPISVDFQKAMAGDEGVREVDEAFSGDIMDEPVIYADGQVEEAKQEE